MTQVNMWIYVKLYFQFIGSLPGIILGMTYGMHELMTQVNMWIYVKLYFQFIGSLPGIILGMTYGMH